MNEFLYILFCLHFLNDGARTAIIALLPFVSKEFHFSFTQVGILGASQGIIGAIFAFPAGIFSSKVGGFKLLILCLLAYGAGITLIGLSPNVLIFFIAFYGATIGFGMFHVIGFSLVSRVSPKARIGQNLGNFTAIGDIGRVVIPAAVIFAATYISWRGSYTSIGILSLTFFILIIVFLRKKNPDTSEKPKIKQSHKEWLGHAFSILKQKNMKLVLIAAVIDGLAGSPIYIFLPFLLLSKGIGTATLGIFTAVYFAGSLLGKSVLGRGVDRFGNARVFIFAELVMAASLVFLVILHQIFLTGIVAFILGLFARGTTPVVTTLFSEVAHADHYEKVFAVSETMLSVTAAVAPAVMGVVADHLGINAVYFFSCSLAVVATAPILLLVKYNTSLSKNP